MKTEYKLALEKIKRVILNSERDIDEVWKAFLAIVDFIKEEKK